ncbi:MAG: ABC transporter ATP-binding protein/permease [Algoriphagus sp.]|jgi:ABC-type multidrug transport system fused ATPase/permease subunit|uniref:ABC transporter ATP-binding protein n=1 Tax=Algoriphagus sp. TaxID=1872435 RepID=UPI00276AAC8E|nr:ABC transporter ATP-binding protein/permease [Algoriphagus sp.]MDP4746966.1 ABC transporter ATP-binding protein/permease [Algoriphagus sp.]MDP4838448.1 ABC transporter ATP-binding protein/permease [Algoriphagus sp.]MDP4903294.1 ABC transporter ATP-binding protein/permease [Algoriphagus sp.]MDP4958263.1 ABC transporter ATP-binding protein/permease [Algoriphagus sp.]
MAPKKERKVTIRQVFSTIIWPRRRQLLIGLVLIIISRIASLVLPGATKFLIDEVIPSNDLQQLKGLIFVVVLAIVIQAVTSYALTQILSVEAQHLISQLRSKVQQHIIKLPIRFFDNSKTGELVSRIMTDVEGVRNLVGTGFAQMIGGGLAAIISLALLISISPSMTAFVLLPVLIFGLVSLKAFGKIRPIFRERGKINAQVTGRLTETLGGIRVIKGFNAENQEIKTFERGVEELFLNVKASLTATSFVTSAGALLLGLASAGIMGLGGYQIMQGQMTFGDFLAFTLYLGFMIAPIVQMSNIGSQLTEAFAGLDRTEEIMNMPLEADDKKRTTKLAGIKGDIRFENVAFAYESGKDVVKGITFDAPAGTVTALVGTSGSGKTTIAGLAATFLNPDSGVVYLDGYDLQSITLDTFRSQLGVVLQDDFLFEGTIRENILFPRPDSSESQLDMAVKAAHVHEFTNRFEKGLDTLIGERGVKLSGGQRQRIAIARAILADPRILILDEATSNLDTESESFIQASLKELMQGRTTFVIAHRLSTIRQADQILVIEQGQIVEQGKHEELLAKKGRYFDLYTYQARI